MIACVHIAGVFQRQAQTAGFLKDTQTGPLAQPRRQRNVEQLHIHAAYVAPHPLVENRVKKLAVLVARDGSRRNLFARLITGVVVAFDDGDELDELRANRVTSRPSFERHDRFAVVCQASAINSR